MSKTGVDAVAKRAKHAKQVPTIIGGQLDKHKREKEKYEEKVRKLNDPEEIKKTELAKIYQLKSDVETEAGIFVAENCKKLKNEIYEFLTDGIDRKAPYGVLEERINLCLELLKEYRKVVENKLINEKAKAKDYTLFDQLFNMLIECNANFLIFAPKQCFKKSTIPSKIRTLPEIYQNAVKEKIERFKEDDKADYVNEYQVCEIEPNEKTEKVQEMSKFLNDTKEEAIDNMVDMADKVGSDLLAFIQAEYEEIKKEKGLVNSKDIENIFTRIKRERDMLNSLVKNNEFISKKMKSRKINTYENLFNHLINLDIRFATKAPGKCFCRLDLDFKTLGEEEKNVVFDRICRYGLWNIPQFVENYHDVFACQIARTNNGVNV
ncbi:MAG: hypothetical protein J6Q13_00535 [Clostridia bacterium]|nr:hypothetical protein [Clostridia bacterium]